MGKAVNCKQCKENYLRFYTDGGDVWWVTCDSCGNHSSPKDTQLEAGIAWNEENSLIPKWVKDFPQTPLGEKIEGKLYEHHLLCSGSRHKPKGSSGCCCFNLRLKGK